MAGTETVMSLQDLIASLDQTCLPRILQVCSGVYFQGSVYELSGSEVCLSTGDLVKVIDIELLSVSCEDTSNNNTFELPINHADLFKLVPEEMPYSTVEEMVSLRPVGLDTCLPFTFTSRCELTLQNSTLGAGVAVTMLHIEQQDGGEESCVRCELRGQQGASAEVLVPFSCCGEFYECESDQTYTLKEIMSSPHLCSRHFCFSKKTKHGASLVFSPIYQVQAIMHLRKNIVKFPSSLEVDVVDVTTQSQDLTFVTPLTLLEVFAQPDEAFPTMAEILEHHEGQPLFRCTWLAELHKGDPLVLHKRGSSAMVLASGLKGRKARQYFLMSQSYGGRLRRRPREFESVYELYAASTQAPFLTVRVTRHSEELEEEGLLALSVGEQLEVLRCEKVKLPGGRTSQEEKNNQTVEVLVCRRLQEVDDDEEEDEEEKEESEVVHLPLYMQSHFVEKLTDNKKYSLKDLCKAFALPLDVKVVSGDTELEKDPLVGFSSLRLQEATIQPMVQASLPGKPERCFEIPTDWLNMSLSFTNDPLPLTQEYHLETVTEVTDSFYYEFRKLTASDEPPPPRPPKPKTSSRSNPPSGSKPLSGSKSSKATPSPSHPDAPCLPPKSGTLSLLSGLSLDSKKTQRPPAPLPPAFKDDAPPLNPRKPMTDVKSGKAQPNTYSKSISRKSNNKAAKYEVQADVDSDHDYEQVDDKLKRAQDNFLFY
ncbi:protein THEMIS2-like isoform X2 [Salvelinus fontinalis]|uniref:protein THEMIS2-like isoform X2 n=1 Tax=Salvelinus fontinalis TaxID=8038 RepID=UPI002485EAE0|nr:protein THEMIS2-like isoform X2 [Salvelinus fontinalis]